MTLEQFLMSALVFLPVAGLAFLALRNTWESKERASNKPALSGPALKPLTSSGLLFRSLTYPFALMLPTTESHRDKIYLELRTAGYYRPNALTEALALRNLLTLAPLLIAGLLASMIEIADIPIAALIGLISAVLGYSLPRLYIQVRGRNRSHEIERGLPTGVDLLTLALTAGLNLQAGLRRAAAELRFSFPDLAQEFDITRRQAELHSLEHGLEELANRVRIPEIRNLALILAQSERLGTNATTVLLEASNTLRTTMRQRAETQANRTSLWMVFPTVGCFLTACGLILIGPVFLELGRHGNETRQMLQEGRKQIGKANPGSIGVKAAPSVSGTLPR